MEQFLKELKTAAEGLGIDLLGVADLAEAHQFIKEQGGAVPAAYPRAVSLGVRLMNAVVDQLPRHDDLSVLNPYRGIYQSINDNLDRAALLLAARLQQAGFNAYPIPASRRADSERLAAVVSHKVAANLAGLGWIGKSCLLVTPEYGPRVRLTTILTDAPLPTRSALRNHCGRCSECVDICPVQAFTGRAFVASEPREARFNAKLCEEYMLAREQHLGESLCGLCVYACPWGRRETVALVRRSIRRPIEVVDEVMGL
jgi:epoxyqueuosine reductase